MTLTFIQGHGCILVKNFGVHFLRNFSVHWMVCSKSCGVLFCFLFFSFALFYFVQIIIIGENSADMFCNEITFNIVLSLIIREPIWYGARHNLTPHFKFSLNDLLFSLFVIF